ncbi:MAG TPA: SAM-dependent methyltransferase [Candidatus Omnitrophota bacterium]|nr:SAM-dependent methyltransferase [Candidatus Omnitrophota bacterium]HPN88444.1 SAM-dependent methyltransferase [Candidatus Omnitrophota bacterium]
MNKLFLIPTPISDTEDFFSFFDSKAWCDVRVFFVEEEKSARRFLKNIIPDIPLSECRFFLLNEHTSSEQLKKDFQSVLGKDIAVLSEAGCPCVADPGAALVLLAHQHDMTVLPFIGPSSILLALMGSGLNGQRFAFHGYLPKEKIARIKKIKELENHSFLDDETQIFMETPYRNSSLFEDILASCSSETYLSIASDILGANQWIKTQHIKEWRRQNKVLPKRPTIFSIYKKQ